MCAAQLVPNDGRNGVRVNVGNPTGTCRVLECCEEDRDWSKALMGNVPANASLASVGHTSDKQHPLDNQTDVPMHAALGTYTILNAGHPLEEATLARHA